MKKNDKVKVESIDGKYILVVYNENISAEKTGLNTHELMLIATMKDTKFTIDNKESIIKLRDFLISLELKEDVEN